MNSDVLMSVVMPHVCDAVCCNLYLGLLCKQSGMVTVQRLIFMIELNGEVYFPGTLV